MKSMRTTIIRECISMVREEKVFKANTLGQAVMLLSKRQLDRFSAVVA